MKKFIGLVALITIITGCATAELKDGSSSVVTFKEGGISADVLYESLKDKYGSEVLINLIDTELLNREYENTEEEDAYVKDVVKSLKNEWEDDFETNITYYYGVKDEGELKDYIRLVYKRNLWTEDYSKSIVTDKEINDYYEKHLVGDITASHILIKSDAKSNATDKEKKEAETKALNLAKEIIAKLNKGEKFEKLAKEYSDDASNSENGGALGAFNDRSNYDANFLEAAIKLEVNKYSSEPVKSQYGYHIIYKTKQADKPKLDKVKTEIINKIASEKVSTDSSFTAKALVALREKYGMKITDSELKKDYEKIYQD